MPSYIVLSSWLFLDIGCCGAKTWAEYRFDLLCYLSVSNAQIGQSVVRACNTKLSLCTE